MKNSDYDALPPHEKSAINLISSINGNCEMDAFGMEKACTIRFDHTNYPKLKAIVNLSGNSLNTIANEIVRVGFGAMIAKMTDEEINTLMTESDKVYQQWSDEVQGSK